jgi:hypothetical protein
MLKNWKFIQNNQINKIKYLDLSKNSYRTPSLIHNFSKKYYNGLFERPTHNVFSHLAILSSIQAIEHFKYTFDISWCLSIALTSAGIRLLQIPTYWLIKDIQFQKYLPKRLNKFVQKWYHNLILIDLQIDIKRNKLNQHESEKLTKYYDINLIISYFTQIILLFNYFRGLNSMCKASYSTLYPNFTNDLFGLNLANYDPFFVFPVMVFINNFLLLKVTNHPWLINYNSNNKKLISISFVISLISVFWPQCYAVGWISYCITHILITKITNHLCAWKNDKRDYSRYVERTYKNKIEELYKKY